VTIGISTRIWRTAAYCGLSGAAAAIIGAPAAMADTAVPAQPPSPAIEQPIQSAAADVAPAPPPATALPAAPDAAPSADASATPPEGIPHLSSPENLPPGTSATPTDPAGPRLSYLRYLWHAVQTQDISGGEALLLLSQRPLDAQATPPPGMAAGPQPALPPDAPAPPAH
jgi:hypothetical protein